MSTVHRTTTASPENVWTVLADGWSYAGWVVGASRIRDVSSDWPAVGSLIHHSVGIWPALLDDETEVEISEPPHRLRLHARTGAAGEAFIDFTLTPLSEGCRVTMSEGVLTGPGRLIPKKLTKVLFNKRNDEVLYRLCLLAERAAAEGIVRT